MQQYILRRILAIIPVLLFVSLLIFAMMRIIPGDAALIQVAAGQEATANPEVYERVRHKLGLDRPYHVQYLDWLWHMLRYGDMGTSFWSERPVTEELLRRLPVTLELGIGATIVSLLIAIPAGVISAMRQDTHLDYLARILSVSGLSIPSFWLAILLVVLPAYWFGYMPAMGYVSPFDDLWANLGQFLFPSIAMGLATSATAMRMTRSQMLEVLRQDYIRTARSKGLRERAVVYRHALKNALIPVVTVVGLDLGYLVGRSVVIEPVFVLPGLGSSTFQAIISRDYPQIQANVLFIALLFLVINLAVDAIYGFLDPRIRYH